MRGDCWPEGWHAEEGGKGCERDGDAWKLAEGDVENEGKTRERGERDVRGMLVLVEWVG